MDNPGRPAFARRASAGKCFAWALALSAMLWAVIVWLVAVAVRGAL